MASALAAIWPERFEETYPIWGKQVVLRSLDNPEIEVIDAAVATVPEANRAQAKAEMLVAASIVSVDGLTFTEAKTGTPLTFEQKVEEVRSWNDVLTAVLCDKYKTLQQQHYAVIAELTDPNA